MLQPLLSILAGIIVLTPVIGFSFWNSPGATQPTSTPLRMPIDDTFALKIKGKVVVVGRISEGKVKIGDRLVIRTKAEKLPVEVEGIELEGKAPVKKASEGDRVGILLGGVSKEQVGSGAVLTTP
jgi:translation elongation factor EF-Tu-like GTPase